MTIGKKILWIGLWLILSICFFSFNNKSTANLIWGSVSTYNIETPFVWMDWQAQDPWKDASQIVQQDTSILNKLYQVFWLDVVNKYPWAPKFLLYIKRIINLALWLLSFVCLIMLIYTFYMMFFTGNEEWTKKAKWNLIGIFIALAVIWLSRLIVSFIFRWYQTERQWVQLTYNISIVTELNNYFYSIA